MGGGGEIFYGTVKLGSVPGWERGSKNGKVGGSKGRGESTNEGDV